MSLTDTEFARKVLLNLNSVAIGDEAPANLDTLVKGVSRSVHAMLRKRNICYWDESEIPDEVTDSLAEYIETWLPKTLQPGTGFTETDRRLRFETLKTDASQPYTGKGLRSDYAFNRCNTRTIG